jgi:hypothetical protein
MELGINIAGASGNITESNLVGSIRHANPIITDVVMAEFLSKLEALMAEYRINKVDIAWDHFRPTTGAVDSAEIPEIFDLKPNVVARGHIVFDDPPSN